jgi:spore coat polysaccharide biosynthesis protein SpsF (cytidylyltransferase family)
VVVFTWLCFWCVFGGGVMKIGIVVQARLGSTRLPYKLLKKIHRNKTSIEFLCETMNFVQENYLSKKVDIQPVFAMPANELLDPKMKEVARRIYKHGIPIYFGAENDVYGRVMDCAADYGFDVIVEITADCPFIDPEELFAMVMYAEHCFEHRSDFYFSNVFPERFVLDGNDIQVYSEHLLRVVHSNGMVKNNSHVGWNIFQYVQNSAARWKTYLKPYPIPYIQTNDFLQWLVAQDYRTTLDEKADLKALKKIYPIYKKFMKKNSFMYYYKLWELKNKLFVNKDVKAKKAGEG